MNITVLILLLIVAGTSALALLLTPIARGVGLVDRPNQRKVHSGKIPLVGGLAIYLTVAASLLLLAPIERHSVFLLASVLVMLTGVIDDRWGLSATARFVIQSLGYVLMIFAADIVLMDFGQLFIPATLYLGWLAVPITIFSALGVINAFNMIDGIDGLSGTIFSIAAGCMAYFAFLAGHDGSARVLLVFIAATLGFLLLNARWPWLRQAKVFLGDSGSALLGFALAWFFIDLGQGEDRAFAPITAVWLIAVPLLDTFFLIIKRVRQGQSPFWADSHHLHHAFLKAGFSVRQTWLIITAVAFALAMTGVLGERLDIPEFVMFYLFVAVSISYNRYMGRAWESNRILGRTMQPK